jgi:hypothetical protein
MQGLEQEGDESERSSLCDESERSLLSSPGRARTEVPSKCTTRAAPSGPLSSSILFRSCSTSRHFCRTLKFLTGVCTAQKFLVNQKSDSVEAF